jgi:hypothetical protein
MNYKFEDFPSMRRCTGLPRLSGATSVLLSAIGLQRDPHRSVK